MSNDTSPPSNPTSHPPSNPTSPPPSNPTSPRRLVGSRTSSQHIPTIPSRLREATNMSPEEGIPRVNSIEEAGPSTPSPVISPSLRPDEAHSNIYNPNADGENAHFQASIIEPTQRQFDARTRLLEDYHKSPLCGLKNCNHL